MTHVCCMYVLTLIDSADTPPLPCKGERGQLLQSLEAKLENKSTRVSSVLGKASTLLLVANSHDEQKRPKRGR